MSFPSVFFLSLLMLLILSKGFAQEAVVEPVYQNGECWTFKVLSGKYVGHTTRDLGDGEHRICVANGTLFSIQDGKRYRLSNFWSFAFPLKERDTLKYLDNFPLAIGQKWSHEYQGELRGTNRRIKRTADTHVIGWDTVDTSAGTFKSLKIERGIWDGGTLVEKVTFFWSSQTKSAVKYKYEALVGSSATRDIELIRYERSRQ